MTVVRRRVDVILVVTVLGVAALSAVEPRIASFVIAVGGLAAVWRWPEKALGVATLLVLAVRPSLDVFGERRAGVSILAVNPAVVFGMAILGTGIVLGLRRLRDGSTIWPDSALRHAHLWLLGAYAVGLFAGGWFYGATGASTGVRDAVRMSSIVAAFLLVCWWVEEDVRRVRRAWMLLLLGMVLPVAFAIWQGITGRGWIEDDGLNRLQGTFSHPNSLGPYLAPFILLAVGALSALRGWTRILLALAAAGLAWIVALTYSRTGILVVVVGLASLIALRVLRFGIKEMSRALVITILFALATWWLFGDVIRERFTGLTLGNGAWALAQAGESENSFTWRLVNWFVLTTLGLEHPIIGHGVGMTTVLNPLVSNINGVPYNAHDDFVRWFFEGGVLGLTAYVAYGVAVCAWAVRRARNASVELSAAAYAVAASWLAMFFFTAGTPEMSLQTAIQYELYGMLALIGVASGRSAITGPPVEGHTSATYRRDP